MNLLKLFRHIKSMLWGHPTLHTVPDRLLLKKLQWFHGADSPVLFMIDDLTNAWCLEDAGEPGRPAYDWGGKHQNKISIIQFLHEKLFTDFPKIKTTYFTVVGEMFSFNRKSHFGGAFPITHDQAALDFFRSLQTSENSEIAYHGVHHGIPQERSEDYIQEWKSFQNLEQALNTIDAGKTIYREAFGHNPMGGKYCGYQKNAFSDESIAKSGFTWWCRDWTPCDVSGKSPDYLYDLEFFGAKDKVVSIPSTIHGKNWTRSQVETLLSRNQVISIQEHISPMRPDGRVQTPNIVDDINDLRELFNYLRNKNVWFTTCSELAHYFIGYTHSLFYNFKKSSFQVEYTGTLDEPVITIILSAEALCDLRNPYIRLILPGGQTLSGRNISSTRRPYEFMVDLPLRSGKYALHAVPEPV